MKMKVVLPLRLVPLPVLAGESLALYEWQQKAEHRTTEPPLSRWMAGSQAETIADFSEEGENAMAVVHAGLYVL
jgi:hypothetical protein